MRGTTWAVFAIGAGLVLGTARPGVGQGLYAPAPGAELERLSRQMADAVRVLGDRIVAQPPQVPSGPYLARDAQELERATGEWYASLRGRNDPYLVRRTYSGIDAAWHRLRAQLGAPGVANPALMADIARVEQVDAQIHEALRLNGYPPNYDAALAPPSGPDELRRLAYAIAQRGEALASIIQVDYGPDPRFVSVVNDAAEVARLSDAFNDGLNNPNALLKPEILRVVFSQTVQKANSLAAALAQTQIPPRVRAAYDDFSAVFNLIRANLGMGAPTANGLPGGPALAPAGGIPYDANPAARVGHWADELDRQVEVLLAEFAPTASVVPEGRAMLDEMVRLRDDARRFRAEAAQGPDPGRLAFRFREVDASSQRLSRHIARIARGRTGPNIQRVQQIRQTCEQIHRILGMPGYPPTFGPNEDIR